MLSEGCYLAFTMDGLARACGLSRQTLYNQFADRDALYRQSRRRLLDGFVGVLPLEFVPAVPLECFVERTMSVLANSQHVELSRSAERDGAACPWVALLYRSQVERPLAAIAERHIAPLAPALADPAAQAAELVAMLRAAVRGPSPSFSPAELTRLFMRRLSSAPAQLERAVA
jgi:AcrR family transcriptional regulator